MKVFISWSGDTSKSVALALREWLPKVIQSVEPWLSNQDIASGARWPQALGGQLQDLNMGILCLTADNLVAPWLLFEAGALSKTLNDSLVCPYLFEIGETEVSGPLAQFQGEKADQDGTRKLVATINNIAGTSRLESHRLEEAFEKWWPDLEQRLQSIQPTRTRGPERSERDLLEEILKHVRSLSQEQKMERGLRLAKPFIDAYRFPNPLSDSSPSSYLNSPEAISAVLRNNLRTCDPDKLIAQLEALQSEIKEERDRQQALNELYQTKIKDENKKN